MNRRTLFGLLIGAAGTAKAETPAFQKAAADGGEQAIPLPQLEIPLRSYGRTSDVEFGVSDNTPQQGVVMFHREVPSKRCIRLTYLNEAVELNQQQVLALARFAKTLAPE